MKRLFILVLILTPGFCIANAQSKASGVTQTLKAEQEVSRLERQWLDAGHNKNVAVMRQILAEGFIITFGDGSTRDKAEVIRRLSAGTINPNESDWTEDSTVRIYGDTAIITGRYMYKLRDRDKETISASRYTDTYVKLNGRWQVVASHLSNIVQR